MQRFGDEPPLIEYPCEWSYRVIGPSAELIETALRGILGEADYELVPSNTSRTGKYVALKLTLIVESERRRLEVGRLLKEDASILYVL